MAEKDPVKEYHEYLAEQFSNSEILKKAEEIFTERGGVFELDEFRAICVNIYYLAQNELLGRIRV